MTFEEAVGRARAAKGCRAPQILDWVRSGSTERRSPWAVFGCCDAGYVPRLLVALQSVRRHHPGVDAFLFCRGADPHHVEAARRVGVEVVDWDPSVEFAALDGASRGSWPRECFGHLAAWRLLLAKGYRRSFSIDGDMLCCAAMPLREIEADPGDVACVCNGSVGQHIRVAECGGDALEEFSRRVCWHWRRAANTGIVFWNHAALEASGFAQKIVELVGWRGGGLWMPSDQHLFALALAVHEPRVRWLDTRWNFTSGQETGRGRLAVGPANWLPDSKVGKIGDIFMLHFFKPWELLANPGRLSGTSGGSALVRQALETWMRLAREVFGEGWCGPLRCPSAGQAIPPPVIRSCTAARWLLRLAYPLVVLACQAQREWRRWLDFLKLRAPRDLTPSVLALVLPCLRPWPMIRRARQTQTSPPPLQ